MRTTGLVVLWLAATMAGAEQAPSRADILEQLRARWIASSAYTVAVAERMPADRYSFRPTPEQMTFGEQLLHIADQNELILAEVRGAAAPSPRRGGAAKADVLARLDETRTLGLDMLQERSAPAAANTADLLNGLMLALDHTTHHRGQAVVYLRLNGITPPEYRR